MNFKICSKCGIKKSVFMFYFRKKGPRKGEYYEKCSECMKERGRKYYYLNHKRQLSLALKRRAKYRKEIRQFLDLVKSKPCKDCGGVYPPCAMDFDHREGQIKEKEMSDIADRAEDEAELKLDVGLRNIALAAWRYCRSRRMRGVAPESSTASTTTDPE